MIGLSDAVMPARRGERRGTNHRAGSITMDTIARTPSRSLALCLIGLASLHTQAAAPARPDVDLIVQVRVISEADEAADHADPAGASTAAAPRGLSISSAAPAVASAPTQEIRVHNGGQASMSWSQTMPIQWLQAASYRGSTASGGGSNGTGGLVNALVWLRAGQSLNLRPSWPGGRHAVRVELRLDTESLGERQGSEVPSTHHQASASTLSVPLGRWTTFAATGTASPPQSPNTWSTQPPSGRQLMQLRVSTD